MKWGPGSPDGELSGLESKSEVADDNAIEENKEDEEAVEEAQSTLDELASPETDWRDGTVDDVLRKGEYAFLPVFGFNEGHVAVRRYAERLEMDDAELFDEEAFSKGRMFAEEKYEGEPTRLDGKELSWWEGDSIMPKHPFILINPVGFTTADADAKDFRDLFRLQKGEQFTFSDSGGYQIMSMDEAEIVESREEHEFQEYNVYPERLLEWQVSNADAGASIDFPPYNISGDSNFPDAVKHTEEWRKFYDRRRKRSAKMALRMGIRLQEMRSEGDRDALDYIYAPVIHGKPHPKRTHSYLSRWHGAIVKALDFWPRGWTLKPEPSSSFGQIALHLAYAEECLLNNGEDEPNTDYLHVLMVGGLLQKCLIMYFARDVDAMVTSDASTYAAGGKRRQFDLPKTARRRCVIISNRDDEEREDSAMDATRLDRYPCRCQVCSTVERTAGFEFITEGTDSARNATMNLHNLHQALSIERTLDALLREEDTQIAETGGEPTGSEFWRFIKTLTPEKRVEDLYRAMDYIRLTKEEGIDEANRQYRILWDSSSGRTVLPASSSADW